MMMFHMKLGSLLPSIIDIAKEAGEAILAIYQQGQFEHQLKADLTPVTTADMQAHNILVQRLTKLTPDIPILSEEGADIPLEVRRAWQAYWLVDPLDGTQEFISGTGDFTTVIALVVNQQPVMGVVYCPVKDTLFYAIKSHGAWKQTGKNRPISLAVKQHAANDKSLAITIGYRQNQTKTCSRFSKEWQPHLTLLGSASLKSCLVAEGAADCYLRIGPTGEWDTAAVQCIVEEAGGAIRSLKWHSLTYNQRRSLENPNFIVIGDKQLPWQNILD